MDQPDDEELAALAQPAPEVPDPLVGTTVAGFHLERVLGKGGVGTVYLAADPETAAPTALKVLHPHISDDTEVRKFLRGANVARGIAHENIVDVRAVGRCEVSGRHWMAMELVSGTTLESLLEERGPLPIEEALGYVLQACDGLAAVHAAGVIHRDVKPENLVITDDGVVKITDVGLARDIDPDAATTSITGTPHFMPPEQFQGTGMDARTDIYALGVTLYNALTKDFPYNGEGPAQVVFAILTRPPKPLTELLPDAPPALSTAIETMLARAPDDRPADMPAVRALLESSRG